LVVAPRKAAMALSLTYSVEGVNARSGAFVSTSQPQNRIGHGGAPGIDDYPFHLEEGGRHLTISVRRQSEKADCGQERRLGFSFYL
jgi:hypothetical protein